MTILHVITSPRAEGTPRLVLDWLNTPTSHTQAVVFLSRSNDELLGEFQRTGCNIQFIAPMPPGIRKIMHLRREIANACNNVKPDVVISWTTGMSQWVHLGARKAGVKKLLTHAGNPPYGGFIQKYVYSYMSFWIGSLLGSKTVVPSEYILGEFRSIPLLRRKDFFKIYNCVNVAKFMRADNNFPSSNAIMVATLEVHKDHATLLKAWSKLTPDEAPGELLIAGKGTLETSIKDLGSKLGLQRISFLGARSDVPDLLKRSKVFVLSTTTAEGFGTVLIEALAAGTEIVASDVPACREVLQNGTYGTLVRPADPDALARAIAKAFRHKPTAQELKQRQDYSKQFSPASMMNSYLSIVS